MHEAYNFLTKHVEKIKNTEDLLENYKKILIIFSPVIPHLANECLEDLHINEKIIWPRAEKKYLENQEVNYVIQINGKKRGLIITDKDLSEKLLLDIVKKDTSLNRHLNEKKIKKIIFVKNRLMNILI